MNRAAWKLSLTIVWLVLTAVTLFVQASTFLLPPDTIYSLAPRCEWKARYGKECFFCGMTRAFVLISSGDLADAPKYNRGALPLYATLALNQFVACIYMLRRLPVRGGEIIQLHAEREEIACRS